MLYTIQRFSISDNVNVQLYNDDCFNVFPKIKDHSIDLILTDLPYGTTDCEWDKVLPFGELWNKYHRVIKPNGAIVLTASQPFTTDLINSNRKEFRYELIWYKTKSSGFLNARKMPNKSHENICIFYQKLPTYNPQKYEVSKNFAKKGKLVGNAGSQLFKIRGPKSQDYQYIDDGSRFPDSVLCFPSESEKGMHPTQKPLSLMRFLLLSYSNEGDLVLDNCMGSGTTGVACAELNRSFIGIEKDKDIFLKARRRILMPNQFYLN
ncbi:DNA-methyltransferase [Leptospira meyeri]|uniref:DNA-methyltransferase n=1 Tax=Leptospira meyeri TaxID=29508 RepID=UPI0010823A96|nr:site-specific DNA-methyltransferase [Leptospira meyeri]TGM22001.1 site-specific DNA-methyltransferase [Leptospira meyeri]